MSTDSKYPKWVEGLDEDLRKPAHQLHRACGTVNARQREYRNSQTSGTRADLEGAYQDLRDTMIEIFESGPAEKNPLWTIVTKINTLNIIGAFNPYGMNQIINAVWTLKKEAEERKDETQSRFFGRLKARITYSPLIRATYYGGPVSIRGEHHHFRGVPKSIRDEVGMKATTHPENIPQIIKAYEMMCGDKMLTDSAKKQMEAELNDLGETLTPIINRWEKRNKARETQQS